MEDSNQMQVVPQAEKPALEVSVIVPARNEEASLPTCLASLLGQDEAGFELGRHWEILLVDDASTDGTAGIIEAAVRPGVIALQAPPLQPGERGGFTGKNNACWHGAQQACGNLLLFTDADTMHEPGSVSRARRELEKYRVAMLSYSPRQVVDGVLQRALMPVVFSELATLYPPAKVNDPNQRVAAANGQFLMAEQDAYFAVGGHRAVGPQVLEDVALARNIKRSKRGLRFRYAPDAVSARMYRSTGAMVEGWTKNLALLFPNAPGLAAMRLLEWLLVVGIPLIVLAYPFWTPLQKGLFAVVWIRVIWRVLGRVLRSNFGLGNGLLGILLGVPLFVVLLLRSHLQVRVRRQVTWKGRQYPVVR